MAYVYILRCRDGSYYVGSARSLELRVEAHQRGHRGQVHGLRRPVRLVWAFETDRIDEA